MPQQPTIANPTAMIRALGLNDQSSPVKLKNGQTQFALNFDVANATWNRRYGRDWEFVQTGMALGNGVLSWDDGTVTEIAQIGTELYDVRFSFTYLFESGIRLIIQDSAGAYWSFGPDLATDNMYGIVVALPSASPQTSDQVIAYGQNIGFVTNSGAVQLGADQNNAVWFAKKYGVSSGVVDISTDWVFTFASGFALKIKDIVGNTWKLYASTQGELKAITV